MRILFLLKPFPLRGKITFPFPRMLLFFHLNGIRINFIFGQEENFLLAAMHTENMPENFGLRTYNTMFFTLSR